MLAVVSSGREETTAANVRAPVSLRPARESAGA